MGKLKFGHDIEAIERICEDIKQVYQLNIQVCLVIGGGNIYRGATAASLGIERATADYMGMLATVMNALALQNSLEKKEVPTRVLSAIPMTSICEPYIRRRAVRHMDKNRVVILASGMGSPFFTTDTAAALRAVETGCEAIFKGTQVDGVYSTDPKLDSNAKRFTEITYRQVLNQELSVMDSAAISLAKENKIPIIIFSIQQSQEFIKVVNNQGRYTVIKENICKNKK